MANDTHVHANFLLVFKIDAKYSMGNFLVIGIITFAHGAIPSWITIKHAEWV
jgi:hypothetical protein